MGDQWQVFMPLWLGVLLSCGVPEPPLTLNIKADGYRGIWYQNQPLDNAYKFKYSGGLGTYCAKHRPFAIYSPEAAKTFFCYGGVDEDYHLQRDLTLSGLDRQDIPGALLHMVSYYDHQTGQVPKPTILLDKRTVDAHDNPVIALDSDGYIWIFSTSHGTNRPSYIHQSQEPFSIGAFDRVHPTFVDDGQARPMDNFSYMQAWYLEDVGFACFFTKYNQPAKRTNYFMHSKDGVAWGEHICLAAIEEGHYQVSAVSGNSLVGSAFNFHPEGQGLNWRTNLYYMQSSDLGATWQNVQGEPLEVPLTEAQNLALVKDYQSEGLLVYLKDILFDEDGLPHILFVTSRGFESGAESGPRTWRLAQWTGAHWQIDSITDSDSNYDMGSLWLEEDGSLALIAPTQQGPQAFNPGGEIVRWRQAPEGMWSVSKQLTSNSPFNHTYVRRTLHGADAFQAFWADGHGRRPSRSSLYFSSSDGNVYILPRKMASDLARPAALD